MNGYYLILILLDLALAVCLLQLMAGFNRGVMALWNLDTSSVELTYVASTVRFMPAVIVIASVDVLSII